MVDEKEYWCGKCIKNKIFFAIFMSFLLDKVHRGGGYNNFHILFFHEKESVIKTLPEIASKFLFTSLRCKLPYLLHIRVANVFKKSNRELLFPH